MTSSEQHVAKTILWRRLDVPGLEYCSLCRVQDGWQIAAEVICALAEGPTHVRYRIACDDGWRTRAVEVACATGALERSLSLRADDAGRWWRAGDEIVDVRGSTDVDLGVTPSTNTLPMRRLSLTVGEAREVTAAWVHFPDLAVQPLRQRYTRTGERTYRYESLESGFTAELVVDEDGLVRTYADFFERLE
jgi:hypothetical protein